MSTIRILTVPLALAVFSLGLSACTTSGVNIGAQMEAVSAEVVAEAAAEADATEAELAQADSGEQGAAELPQELALVPAERAPAPIASNTPPIVAAAYAGPTPSGVQALAAAAAHAPRVRAIHPVPNITPRPVAARSPELDALIARYAAHYELPVEMVRRLAHKESTLNPAARNRIYWGLLQIRHDTARSMGYRGSAEGLLDAETNLNYAVRYLRGAYLTADFNQDRAIRFYQRGYYYDARNKGILRETGLRP
ncbi:MAG: transglycosylase SLT domain-containing protein [Mesorhizobium sp.]|nr:transglycosylase SLT domain-containing protein [Mesorhizobium sp.]